MLYYLLISLTNEVSALNVFRYLTTRTGGAILTALLFVFLFGPSIISLLKKRFLPFSLPTCFSTGSGSAITVSASRSCPLRRRDLFVCPSPAATVRPSSV